MVMKYKWVPSSRDIVYLTSEKKLTVLNVESNSTYVDLSNVEDYMTAQNKILIIQTVVGEKHLNLSIFDAEKKKTYLAEFPVNLKIQQVRVFDFAFDIYYVIAVDDSSNACLWSPTNKQFGFVRKACYHASVNVKTESSFYINRQVEHVR
ncbi:hypothetical protein RF11_10172 [Thelohanellus kitauei]|uniref:Dipeptidylpeptidase IV N-terminal domain-containing protein n=1 Tax=Thelohanellus kitauei TaxID=669202 RepID=A0A0C2MFW4_THEKT|nr:hypothetical protein RF11_10172 [Thelohanellus kitauei]